MLVSQVKPLGQSPSSLHWSAAAGTVHTPTARAAASPNQLGENFEILMHSSSTARCNTPVTPGVLARIRPLQKLAVSAPPGTVTRTRRSGKLAHYFFFSGGVSSMQRYSWGSPTLVPPTVIET